MKPHTDDFTETNACHGKEIPIERFNIADVQVKRNIDDVHTMCEMLLKKFQSYSNQTLARISLIEEALLINGSVSIAHQKSNLVNKIEEANVFITANNLPIQERKHLEAFESNLKNVQFKNIAVISKNLNVIVFLFTAFVNNSMHAL